MGDPRDEEDWIDRVVAFMARFGFSEVRVRWKLMAWQEWAAGLRTRSERSVEEAQAAATVCPTCGALNEKTEESCYKCELPLPSRRVQVLARVVGLGNQIATATVTLSVLVLVVYLRQALAVPGHALTGMTWAELVRVGAYTWDLASEMGQWWRAGSALFLHVGGLHLLYSLWLLRVVVPPLETAFGTRKTVFLFMLLGAGANVASYVMGPWGVSTGVTPALLAMVGLACGWAHREGSRYSAEIRDGMLGWSILTLMLGWMIGANNNCHMAGFVVGGILGLALDPDVMRRRTDSRLDSVLGLLGWAAVAGAVAFCLFTPQSLVVESYLASW